MTAVAAPSPTDEQIKPPSQPPTPAAPSSNGSILGNIGKETTNGTLRWELERFYGSHGFSRQAAGEIARLGAFGSTPPGPFIGGLGIAVALADNPSAKTVDWEALPAPWNLICASFAELTPATTPGATPCLQCDRRERIDRVLDSLGAKWPLRHAVHTLFRAAKRLYRADTRPTVPATESEPAQEAVTEGPTMVPLTRKGLPVTLATEILREHHFAVDVGSRLYVYRGGVYQPHGERLIRQEVKRRLSRHSHLWSSRLADEVVAYIEPDAPTLEHRPRPDLINVQNGLVDTTTRTLLPHDPTYRTTVQLPVAFDPAARCPFWEQFTSDVFPSDAAAAGVQWEIAAVLAVPHASIQQAILLEGEGETGKSAQLAGYVSFIGRHNHTAISLHRLETDRFIAARLLGKLANICPDLPSEHLTGTSVFKAITGGDPITAEYKFGESFDFVPFARLVFSANSPPRSKDATFAFFRRWMVVPFERTFDRSNPNRRERAEIDTALAAPGELSGVLNKVLEVLPRLAQQGITETKAMHEAWTEFRQTTDFVAVWLDQHTVTDPTAYVAKAKLHSNFNQAALQNGIPIMTPKMLGRALKRYRPGLQDGQRSVGGKLAWCWLGLGLSA